ncbi:MAG: VCBS repeat-containing protein, partial [Akkermansiaceae bacterium]|nr:VCBS repeat-containing protein [Akkermansiaceae bacterium]
DVDIYVLRGAWLWEQGKRPDSLLQNQGDGTFRDVTLIAGMGRENHPSQTAAWADYDNDGDLDLFVGNEHSEGNLKLS